MHRTPATRFSAHSACALGALAASALVLSGCSSSVNSLSSSSLSPTAANTGAVTGRIHGGNQAVAGATVNLYFAGPNNISPAGTSQLIATTTSSSDGYGSFNFVVDPIGTSGGNNGSSNHFHCSSASDSTYVFVVAKGGSTVGSNSAANPDAEFIAPMGNCAAINTSTFVNMSEVTTVATIAAIHQFMNTNNLSSAPIEQSISADGIFVSITALSTAMNAVGNLVSRSTGLANGSFTRTGTGNGAQNITVTVTPETAKLNQLANIISSCINFAPSGGTTRNSNCTGIYNAATPSGSTTAPDLLTALFYIFNNTNPSASSVSTLNSYAGTGPYTPTLTSAPTDWSIGINYAATGSCSTGSAASGSFYSSPASISIDQYGNVQVANNNATIGTLSELNALGAPVACTPLTPTVGAYTPTVLSASSTIYVPNNSTDWIYSGSPNSRDIYRYADSLGVPGGVTTLTATEPVLALAADGNGNLFYSTTGGNLFEIPVNTSTSTKINTSTTLGQMTSLAIDERSRIWAASSTNGVNYFLPTFSGTTVTGYGDGVGLASGTQARSVMVSRSGATTSVYAVDSASNSVAAFTITNSGTTATDAGVSSFAQTSFNAAAAGGSNPGAVVLDGNGTLWLANTTSTAVAALNANGSPATPSTGLVKAATAPGNNASAIAIDPAGNIWTTSGPNSITEILGTAAPIFTPYSSALSVGRFQQKP